MHMRGAKFCQGFYLIAIAPSVIENRLAAGKIIEVGDCKTPHVQGTAALPVLRALAITTADEVIARLVAEQQKQAFGDCQRTKDAPRCFPTAFTWLRSQIRPRNPLHPNVHLVRPAICRSLSRLP